MNRVDSLGRAIYKAMKAVLNTLQGSPAQQATDPHQPPQGPASTRRIRGSIAMTQLLEARAGRVTDTMRRVAQRENVPVRWVREQIVAGKLVIPANGRHLPPHGRLDPLGIGKALATKVNACLGTAPVDASPDTERAKIECAVRYGADTVMDLSIEGDLDAARAWLLEVASVPVGTVPTYQAMREHDVAELSPDMLLCTIEAQADQGVDFMTIHAGILREHLPFAKPRIMGIASRGGALLAQWMIHHGRENPLYERFDDVLAILRERDVCLSLGNGLRGACLADGGDEAEMVEMRVVGELAERAREAGVQTMVEGAGHLAFDRIPKQLKTQRKICGGAPVFVLGPVVTDVFPGYDHLTAAIGAVCAAQHGAALLSAITPREHLGPPRLEDIKQGCTAARAAAHAADIARGLPGARAWDDRLARARSESNWSKQFLLAFDPETAEALHNDAAPPSPESNIMFGHDESAARRTREVQRILSANS